MEALSPVLVLVLHALLLQALGNLAGRVLCARCPQEAGRSALQREALRRRSTQAGGGRSTHAGGGYNMKTNHESHLVVVVGRIGPRHTGLCCRQGQQGGKTTTERQFISRLLKPHLATLYYQMKL